MTSPPSEAPVEPGLLRVQVRIGSVVTIAIGAAALLGWAARLPSLQSLGLGHPAMKVNTAICLILIGASTWLAAGERRGPVSTGLAILGGALGLATLVEHLLNVNLGIDQALLADPGPLAAGEQPGRMSAYSGASVVILAISQLRSRRAEGHPRNDLLLMLPVFFLGGLSLIGAIFGSHAPRSLLGFSDLPIATAIAILVVGYAILGIRGTRGALGIFVDPGPGRELARWAVPLAIIITVGFSLARLEGERLGFYDTEFGLTLHTTAELLALLLVIWLYARSVSTTDRVRRDAASRISTTRQALGESEARLREITDHIQEAFFSVDLETGQTIYVSQAWSAIWGRPLEEVYTNPMAWFDSLHPDDRERLGASLERVRHGTPGDDTFRVVRPDGTTRWLRGRTYPVRDDDGVIRRFVGIAEDVTELRQSEERFVQAQKMEAVGRLAGGVAHDFNNMLTVILAEVELGRPDLPPESPVHESFDAIQRASENATSLTRQLLAFSRKQLVQPVVFDMNDAVTSTAKLLRRVIGEDISMETRLGGTASVLVDRGQFEQVLTNLAVNARDAMPKGGHLRIETSVVELDPSYAADRTEVTPGAYALVSVSDTGTGIAPEVKDRIFEPFFTTKERGKGTGLGLATCFGIVKKAGGHLAVYSEVGLGTTFRVYLPLVRGPSSPVDTAQQLEIPRGSETILMVEDDPGVRRAGVRMLKGLGYTVLEARDATEAFERLREHAGTVALLLTDVVLPGMGGRDLAEQVRREHPHIKVLFTTGYTDDVILQHQLISRNVTILQKPYTRSTLARGVRTVIDRA